MTLNINSVYMAKNIWKTKVFHAAFEKELKNFATFNGCKNIAIDKVNLI